MQKLKPIKQENKINIPCPICQKEMIQTEIPLAFRMSKIKYMFFCECKKVTLLIQEILEFIE